MKELIEHGIIVKSLRTIMPIAGQSATPYPYTFTHSLLYEELLRETVADTDALLTLFEQSLPVYSLRPWKLVAEASLADHSSERVQRFVDNLCETILGLKLRELRHQELAHRFRDILNTVCQNNAEKITYESAPELYLQILFTKLYAVSATMYGVQHAELIEEYNQLTESPENLQAAVHQCQALSYRILSRTDTSQTEATMHTIIALADKFPELWQEKAFISIIGHIALRTKDLQHYVRARELTLKALSFEHNILNNAPALINTASQIVHCCYRVVSTSKQIEEGLDFIRHIKDVFASENEMAQFFLSIGHINILIHSGNVVEALQLIKACSNPRIFDAHIDALFFIKRLLYSAEMALCTDTALIDRDIAENLEWKMANGQTTIPRSHIHLAYDLITDSILCGKAEWGRSIATRLCNGDSSKHSSHMQFVEHVLTKKLAHDTEPDTSAYNFDILTKAVQHGGDREVLASNARERLNIEICSLRTLLHIRLVIALIESIDEKIPAFNFAGLMRDNIALALKKVLTWTEQHSIPGFMKPFLPLAHTYLPQKEAAQWEKSIARLQGEVAHLQTLREDHTTSSNRTIISMVEHISIQRPGSYPETVQGARVRHVLGMMVANAMMPYPMSYADFREIAIGDKDNNTGSYLRTLVGRIRKLIGKESVITDGATPPRLNLSLVEVDLLQISDMLKQARQARDSGYPRKTREAILRVLTTLQSAPIYPGLYNEFFEAARLEFDRRVRDEVIGSARLLYGEDDLEGVAEILRPAFRNTPYDDEITELLIEVLNRSGYHTEAISIRKQWERAIQA